MGQRRSAVIEQVFLADRNKRLIWAFSTVFLSDQTQVAMHSVDVTPGFLAFLVLADPFLPDQSVGPIPD